MGEKRKDTENRTGREGGRDGGREGGSEREQREQCRLEQLEG